MNLKEMEYLVALDEYRNFSKAADNIFVTQPALSRFLSNLEKECGTKLFKKTAKNIIPTAAGELYIRFARDTLKRWNHLNEEILGTKSEKTLKIGIPQNLSPILVKAIVKSKNMFPEMRIELYEDMYPNITSAIHNQTLDLAFVGSKSDAKTYQSEFVMNEVIMVCMPESFMIRPHESKGIPFFNLEDLKGHSLILPIENHEFNRTINHLFSSSSIPMEDTFFTKNHLMAFELSTRGYGIALIAMPMTNSQDLFFYQNFIRQDNFIFCRLSEEPILLPLYAVYNPDTSDDSARVFLQTLHQTLFVDPVDSQGK